MNGYQISHFIGLDGVPVIQIDTDGLDGMPRINLNDSTLYNGDPEKHEVPGLPVELPEDDDERACENCGDEVQYLSSHDLCDTCEALEECPLCGDRIDPDLMNRWPNLKEPVKMCNSCHHDARRSGWEPGR